MASSTRIKIALGLFLARSVSSCVATIRPKSGVKPTCQDSWTDAFDPKADMAERALATATAVPIEEPVCLEKHPRPLRSPPSSASVLAVSNSSAIPSSKLIPPPNVIVRLMAARAAAGFIVRPSAYCCTWRLRSSGFTTSSTNPNPAPEARPASSLHTNSE